jgi:hypothetical protein
MTIPLLYVTGFPLIAISGKGSFFRLVVMLCFLVNYGLRKFPVHPESIKARVDTLLICIYIIKLLE